MKQKQQVMKTEKMDDLLDTYNDYKRLADFFKDLSYGTKSGRSVAGNEKA